MKKSMICAIAALAAGFVFAEDDSAGNDVSPLGVSLVAPLQDPFIEDDVCGLRLNLLMAMNNDVCGLDLGLVGINNGCMKGMQLNAFNWVNGDVDALQIGVLANVSRGDVAALQAGLFNVVSGDVKGMQLSLVSYEDSFAGLQLAGVLNWNAADSVGAQFALGNADIENFDGFSCGALNWAFSMTGFQLGLFNFSEEAVGLQLGVFNAANDMTGFQIGLVNLICESPLPVMTVVNAKF
jgi:hypothetical protein